MKNFLAGARDDPEFSRRARLSYLSTEKRDEYHRLWKTLSSRRTAVFPATASARTVAALCYVKNAHSARKRLPRPIGIDGRERRAERAGDRGKGNAEGGSDTAVRRTGGEVKRLRFAIRGLKLAGGPGGGERFPRELARLLRALRRTVSTARSIAPLTATPLSG